MRIAVVHHAVDDGDGPEEQDVLAQAEIVRETLKGLGHRVFQVSCTLNFEDVRDRLEACSPDLVFNLVECLDGKGSLIHLLPFFLDALALPYTGCPAGAILKTSNKIAAKRLMKASGLPTPIWIGPFSDASNPMATPVNGRMSKTTWIIKSVWEHASMGLDDRSVVRTSSIRDLWHQMRLRAPLMGGDCFSESFIFGREFNLSLLGGSNKPQVLPPAEMLFQGYEPKKPRIVGYAAKWNTGSREYHQTLRRFGFGREDGLLLGTMSDLALACWEAFGLRGYARVDFRVDESGCPWILEINTNPCLSPDAGFVAALRRAGFSFPEALERIVGDAMARRRPETILQEISPEVALKGLGGCRKTGYVSNSPHL